MINFCKCCLLLSLCCSFASLCARSLSPSKTACGSTPVLFSPPSPVCRNDCLHNNCNFVNVVCDLLFSFCLSCFTAPFLSNFCHVFCKICSPPTVGSTFLKNSCKQSALINLRFGSLLGAFSPWVPLRRALIRQYQCCCHPCPGHFFH